MRLHTVVAAVALASVFVSTPAHAAEVLPNELGKCTLHISAEEQEAIAEFDMHALGTQREFAIAEAIEAAYPHLRAPVDEFVDSEVVSDYFDKVHGLHVVSEEEKERIRAEYTRQRVALPKDPRLTAVPEALPLVEPYIEARLEARRAEIAKWNECATVQWRFDGRTTFDIAPRPETRPVAAEDTPEGSLEAALAQLQVTPERQEAFTGAFLGSKYARMLPSKSAYERRSETFGSACAQAIAAGSKAEVTVTAEPFMISEPTLEPEKAAEPEAPQTTVFGADEVTDTSSLSTGGIVGIVIGVLAVLGLVAAALPF